MALFEIRGLVKRFDDEVVLDGVDLDIHEGEFLTIIGQSGCGKSVLLKHLIGLFQPDAGSIVFDGRELTGLREREWVEQLRLLADARRNDAILAWLARHAPGRRVLEIGCGTGLLACAAARLGARRVLAVEASPIAAVARALVRDNGLEDRVEVIEAELGDLAPRPVDLVFGELLNADPFVEGVVETFAQGAAWLGPEGRMAPRSLAVHAALMAAGETADEVAAARAEVAGVAERFDLDVGALGEITRPAEAYAFVAPRAASLGPSARLFEVELGRAPEPPGRATVELTAAEDGAAGGVVIWFEASLDDDLAIANPPERPGHFGVLRLDFAETRSVRAGDTVAIEATVDERLTVRAVEPRSE